MANQRLWEIPLKNEWAQILHTACDRPLIGIPIIESTSRKLVAMFTFGTARKQDYYEVLQMVRGIVKDHNDPIKQALIPQIAKRQRNQLLKEQRNAKTTGNYDEAHDPRFSL